MTTEAPEVEVLEARAVHGVGALNVVTSRGDVKAYSGDLVVTVKFTEKYNDWEGKEQEKEVTDSFVIPKIARDLAGIAATRDDSVVEEETLEEPPAEPPPPSTPPPEGGSSPNL